MDRRVHVPVHHKNMNLLYSEIKPVDKGNSSSIQANWSSRCYHLDLCTDLFANVILRWCTMRGGEADTRLKNYKLSSLPAYTESTKCTMIFS